MSSGPVSIPCPACRQLHSLPAELLGKAFTCPRCRAAFVLPRAAPAPAPPMAVLPAGPRPPHLAAALPVALAQPAAVPATHLPPQESIAPLPSPDAATGRQRGQFMGAILLGLVGTVILAAALGPIYY